MKARRYQYVVDEMSAIAATRVLEVGTWSGDRALEMARAALMYTSTFTYDGFDLFEDMTPEKSQSEFNVKRVFDCALIGNKLNSWSQDHAPGFYFRLHKGDTRVTLQEYFVRYGAQSVDFAWIDGGHSIETIASDWSYVSLLVRPGGVILLDDYYVDLPGDGIEKFGCNKLVVELSRKGLAPEILPECDAVKGGGSVQVVKVRV